MAALETSPEGAGESVARGARDLSPPERAARRLWFGYWNAMRRYHRFSVRGLERALAGGPVMIAGYHGRPIAHDLVMLQALMLDETGDMPRAVMHRAFAETPVLRWLFVGGEFLAGEDEEVARALAAGSSLIVTPGGTREGCRSLRSRYRVDWSGRLGYLRLALRHRLPIVPAASAGVDDTYVGLNDGHAWGRRLGLPRGIPAWLGLGPLGPWPLSPPFPVRITLHLGEPIALGSLDPEDRVGLERLHARVQARVQALLDEARAGRR